MSVRKGGFTYCRAASRFSSELGWSGTRMIHSSLGVERMELDIVVVVVVAGCC